MSNPLSTFLAEMSKFDLLSLEEEKILFTTIQDLREEIIHELNTTGVLYNKIPNLLFMIQDCGEALKTYVATYKHDMKIKEVTSFAIDQLSEYKSCYEERILSKNIGLVYKLDGIISELCLEDAFIDECANHILSMSSDDSYTDAHISPTQLENVQIRLYKLCKTIRSTKDYVVQSNLRLVVSQAKKYHNAQGYMQLNDLIQEGSIGLMRAVERFDVDMENKFSTLATWWVRQAIIRSLENNSRTIRVPVGVQNIESKIKKIRDKFFEAGKKEPTDAELAKELRISVERVREVLASNTLTTSIDTPVGEEGDNMTLADVIPDSSLNSGFDQIRQKEIHTQITSLVKSLSDQERTLLEMRYGLDGSDPQSLHEIAFAMECHKQTIQNYEQKILEKLKRKMHR